MTRLELQVLRLAYQKSEFRNQLIPLLQKTAGPLVDPSKLRYQAIFMMGAGGSGKSYVAHKWLKYMPGGGATGYTREDLKKNTPVLSEKERSLTDLKFENIIAKLRSRGIEIEVTNDNSVIIPFKLYNYDADGSERFLHPNDWAKQLPPDIYQQVRGLTKLIFNTPKHELPSFWRQVNPDVYKEEIPGYSKKDPGYVHEMSSEMAQTYFEAAIKTGDPLFIDGTGGNLLKMRTKFSQAQQAGYKISLVFVTTPLTVNQIRNAIRARKVNPNIISDQWFQTQRNFGLLRQEADKAVVIDNRNDQVDIKNWKLHGEEIDAFIKNKTEYSSLFDLIRQTRPEELAFWGKIIHQA